MTEIDQTQLKTILLKLLDKAGTDPRLTPRILRNKTEDKMGLERGKLKIKREYIKTLIVKWWYANNSKNSDKASTDQETEWKLLIKVAKAASKWPAIGKNLDSLSVVDKIKSLKKKLKDNNLVFSDPPTEEEIESIRKETDLKKDSIGVDQGNIIGKKRRAEQSSSSSSKEEKNTKTQKQETEQKEVKPKKIIQYNSSDEEGDF